MNLNNFENHVEPVIVSRGRSYYHDHAVLDLEELQTGEWIAEVDGTAVYQVAISLNGKNIRDWECDCPFDMGPICKHVVAVLYAIREISIAEKEDGTRKKSPQKKQEINRIFEKVSKKDLEEFIRKQIKTTSGFKNAFVAHFADLLEESADQKYRKILINSYKSALGREPFIDSRQAKKLISPVAELSQRATEFLYDKNIRESLEICKALIELIPTFIPFMDEEGYFLREEMESAFDNLFEIAAGAHPQLKEELFDYCLTEYPKRKYHDMGMDGYFLSLLNSLIMSESQEKRFFELIDNEIKELEKDDSFNSYRIVSLVEKKCAYLSSVNRTKEAHEIIEEYCRYSHFRKILIEQAIQAKDYDRARNLCQEGLKLAGKSLYMGQEKMWYDYLLKIAEKERNIPEIRRIAEKLFFEDYFKIDYYRKIKRTYPREKWPEACEKIIDRIKGPDARGNYLNVSILAKIFIEEHYYQRLLKLLQLNAREIHFVSEFAGVLKDKYPADIIKICEEGIREFAQNTGRGNYEELTKYMDQLKTVKGGAKKVKELIAYFRNEYRRRPAMIEILNKKFPEA